MSSKRAWSNWLTDFFRTSKMVGFLPDADYVGDIYTGSDYEFDTLSAMAGVVICTALTKSREANFVAELTCLPIEFVKTVLRVMNEINLWVYWEYQSLSAQLNPTPSDPLSVEELCFGVA